MASLPEKRVPRSAGRSTWRGRAFLGPGRALYVGPAADTSRHTHHALQIAVALQGDFVLEVAGSARRPHCAGAILASDVEHRLEGVGADLLLAYVEPESAFGRALSRGPRVRLLSAVERAAVRAAADRARAGSVTGLRAASLFDAVLGAIGAPAATAAPLDGRLVQALAQLRHRLPAPGSLVALARSVGLSPGRFRHLFSAELGLPAKRYVLWLRLLAAGQALAAGASLTDAAVGAGFSDAAHLTRTFRRMLGVVPSALASALAPMP